MVIKNKKSNTKQKTIIINDNTINNTQKGSFLKGLLISSLISLSLIMTIGFLNNFNPRIIGSMAANCTFAIIIVGLISKFNKMGNLKLALISIGVIILLFIFFGINAK